MITKFTNDQLLLANYRLALENNVLLEISISNQVSIMKHFGIPIEAKLDLIQRVVPGYKNPKPDKELNEQLDYAKNLIGPLQARLWDYVEQVEQARKQGDEWVFGKKHEQ